MRDHLFLMGIAAIASLRLLLAWLRMRLYRKHRRRFQESDSRAVREGWAAALRSRSQWALSWVAGLVLCVGFGFVVLRHPQTPRALRDGFAGAVLYWLLGRACVEGYYLLNRYMALAQPRATRRTARRFPRSGLLLELMLVIFVLAPAAVAAATEPSWFLICGAASLGVQALLALGRLIFPGRRLAAPTQSEEAG